MIKWLGHYLGTGKSEDSAGLVKTGIFNPCGVARIQHGHCANQHRLLHPADNYDLICMTASGSKIA